MSTEATKGSSPGPKTIDVPSRRYGSYRLRARLGQGGQAEVFLAAARDPAGKLVQVALKLMRPDGEETAFAAEADLMGLLSHPNLVALVEYGLAFGRPFIAMEYLAAGDLSAVLAAHARAGTPVPVGMALHVALEVLRALAFFHTARTRSGTPLDLVHSDVNPANVFLSDEGDVKLGDFGVASSARADLGGGPGVSAGKLSYLSPEQTRAEAVGPASDLWAVGVLLHELLLGSHPFRRPGAADEEVMALIRSPRLQFGALDAPLADVLRRALSPELKARFRSAGDFAGALFGYALDRNLLPRKAEVRAWLSGTLGLKAPT